ncbi:MAG: FAD-dependent oxidoreductase [Planctomycetes bacterium]|nr:FAD-dependent oxidoreductase [Planctomycetota bacterium]
MFAGWQLARWGYQPIILERGQPVQTRHRDVMQKFYRQREFNPEYNLLFGAGGAGTYSDGKLYTRVNDPHGSMVLQVLYEHGASPDILIDGRPHIGSDRLPNICQRIRQRIESMGGEIRFGARVNDLSIGDDDQVVGVELASGVLESEAVLLGVGHSARDTLRMLARRGVRLEAKPFQLGVRIEHPQELVDRWQYGSCAGHERLPPAHYQAVAKKAGGARGDLFTFCMCPGGIILPTNESPDLVVTNGASRAGRSGRFANSGLVITVEPSEFDCDPLLGLAYQRKWEALAFQATGGSYAVPAQRAADFLAGRNSDGQLETSYPLGGQWADLRQLLPDYLADSLMRGLRMLDRRLPGFAGEQALITAPETRASAPVRIPRSAETRESVSTPGLYPIGEGAGYAGGIMSAAIDGLKTANEIIRRFAVPR